MNFIEKIHGFVWGPWLLLFFLGAGVLFTVRLKGFQLFKIGCWWKCTVGTLGGKEQGDRANFATACTALAATVGTGNIAGVATAITAGGPGAVFWMWVSALFGMATAYGETFLGIKYRYRGEDGHYISGPFVYLERGLGSKGLGMAYAFFCVMASLGMGSMVQANSISESFYFAFHFSPVVCGVLVALLAMAVVMGGIRRISDTATKLVPFSAGLYMILCGIVLLTCFDRIPVAFAAIFKDAFSLKSAAEGAAGYGISKAVQYGIARGVFSNEAGLGSLAILHGSARETTPEEQGMWAMFEVFFDTIISCTLTALVILCVTGGESRAGLPEGSAMMAYCFSVFFGNAGAVMTAVTMALFAFATIIAWFYLGRQAAVYLTEGMRGKRILLGVYGFLYINAVFFGCVASLPLVWSISDIFNALMAVPNLVGILLLTGEVKKPFQKKTVKPGSDFRR